MESLVNSELLKKVDEWLEAKAIEFYSRLEKFQEGTWLGIDRGRGKCRLQSSGRTVVARVNGGARNSPIGSRCWFDGKMIYLTPTLNETIEKKKKNPEFDVSEDFTELPIPDEFLPPCTMFGIKSRGFFSWYKDWIISGPSGEIRITARQERPANKWWEEPYPQVTQQMLSGNFWAVSWPAPTNDTTGWYFWPQHGFYGYGGSFADDTHSMAYLNTARLVKQHDERFKIYFSPDNSMLSLNQEPSGPDGQPSDEWNIRWVQPEGTSDIHFFAMQCYGYGAVVAAEQNNGSLIFDWPSLGSSPQDAKNNANGANGENRYKGGDWIHIHPQRKCVKELDFEEGCYGGAFGWAPQEYEGYGQPYVGAILTGCPAVLRGQATLVNEDGNSPIGPFSPFNVKWKCFGSQPGHGPAGITSDNSGFMMGQASPPDIMFPTEDDFLDHWGSDKVNPDSLIATEAGKRAWITKEPRTGTERPLPPSEFPFTLPYDGVVGGDRWQFCSSLNGKWWGYYLSGILQAKDNATWLDVSGTSAGNPDYKGQLGPGSEGLNRYLTDTVPGLFYDESIQLDKQPRDSGTKPLLSITRMRVNTVDQTYEYETFYYVPTSTCPDGNYRADVNGIGTICDVVFEDASTEALLEYAWDDDPRVADGVGFFVNPGPTFSIPLEDRVYHEQYHYDPVRQWLWDFQRYQMRIAQDEDGNYAGAYKSFLAIDNRITDGYIYDMGYWVKPENVEEKTPEFQKWVQNCYNGVYDYDGTIVCPIATPETLAQMGVTTTEAEEPYETNEFEGMLWLCLKHEDGETKQPGAKYGTEPGTISGRGMEN